MPGIDEESISALKEAKTKEVFFALVVKNANVGAMLVNKTGKVPTKLIDKAKDDCDTKTTVVGRCFAKNGLLTVKTVKPVDTNGETLTKKLVKEAGFTHCAFTTDKDAENDPSIKPGTQGVKDDRAAGLKRRLDVIEQWCEANKDGLGTKDTVDRAVLVIEQVNEALKANDLVEAEKKLVLVEKYVNLSKPGSTTPTGTVGTTEQPKPSGGGKAEEPPQAADGDRRMVQGA